MYYAIYDKSTPASREVFLSLKLLECAPEDKWTETIIECIIRISSLRDGKFWAARLLDVLFYDDLEARRREDFVSYGEK